MGEKQMNNNCPAGKNYSSCSECVEYAKEGVCDYPFRNKESEIKFASHFGQRISQLREDEVMHVN